MNPKLNPEWEALEGKPHLVPLNCVPAHYEILTTTPMPSCTDECEQCGAEIKYRHSDHGVVCHQCKTKYSVNIDAEFVDGMWKDLTKLYRIPNGTD